MIARWTLVGLGVLAAAVGGVLYFSDHRLGLLDPATNRPLTLPDGLAAGDRVEVFDTPRSDGWVATLTGARGETLLLRRTDGELRERVTGGYHQVRRLADDEWRRRVARNRVFWQELSPGDRVVLLAAGDTVEWAATVEAVDADGVDLAPLGDEPLRRVRPRDFVVLERLSDADWKARQRASVESPDAPDAGPAD